jgi:glycosyltransferase involved in cell wall biosynthesis
LESHHVRVVPNAVDTAVFGSSPQVVRGPHALVWVGGLWRYKRVDRALRAYRRIRAEFSDATLDIYGEDTDVWRPDADFEFEDGWVNREGRLVWDRIERDLPGLRYRGVVPPATLAQVYSAASNLILPSDGDDFPLVSLEAQACGCLPILPRQGGLAETVLDGQTGFVYSPNTSGALADAALSLWHRRLPTDEQRSAARRWVPMTFTYDRTGQSLLDALAESKLTRMAWCWLIRLEVQRQIRRLLRVTP